MFQAHQQPAYDDSEAVTSVCVDIESQAGIVGIESIDALRFALKGLSECDQGILVHAGDCAETFASCSSHRVGRDVNFLCELSKECPVTIGRIRGQFAKPRSSPVELHSDLGQIPVFRGDIINGTCPTQRRPDPRRMLTAYALCRDMDLPPSLFSSHECLLLPYEESLVRFCERTQRHFSSSAHFLWIGDRTRDLDGAHVEFCRGLSNPIGIKVGPSSNPAVIRDCILRLNPANEYGKITVITRYGAGNVQCNLPQLIEMLRDLNVLYQCDPMHGNTVVLSSGLKTRFVETIMVEIAEVISAHRSVGSRIHGIHLETTGADVTECVGCGVHVDDVPNRYESACDPRLNPTQAKAVVAYTLQLLNHDVKVPSSMASSSRLTTADTSASGSLSFSSDEERSI